MYHFPKFWKHKDTKEVIDHQTYSDLPGEHRANFDECDVTGELIQAPAVDEQKEDVPVLPDISKGTTVDYAFAYQKPTISEDEDDDGKDDSIVGSLTSYVEDGLLSTDMASSSNSDISSQNDFGGFEGGDGGGGGADSAF